MSWCSSASRTAQVLQNKGVADYLAWHVDAACVWHEPGIGSWCWSVRPAGDSPPDGRFAGLEAAGTTDMPRTSKITRNQLDTLTARMAGINLDYVDVASLRTLMSLVRRGLLSRTTTCSGWSYSLTEAGMAACESRFDELMTATIECVSSLIVSTLENQGENLGDPSREIDGSMAVRVLSEMQFHIDDLGAYLCEHLPYTPAEIRQQTLVVDICKRLAGIMLGEMVDTALGQQVASIPADRPLARRALAQHRHEIGAGPQVINLPAVPVAAQPKPVVAAQPEVLQVPWGLQPPAGMTPRAAWGARAIYHASADAPIELLHDRQGMAGGDADRRELAHRINAAMPILNKRFAHLSPAGDELVTVELGDLLVYGRCRSSYGYLYIGACLTGEPRPALSDDATGCRAEYRRNGRVAFTGGSQGEHSLDLSVSSNERIVSHFAGYCAQQSPTTGTVGGAA